MRALLAHKKKGIIVLIILILCILLIGSYFIIFRTEQDPGAIDAKNTFELYYNHMLDKNFQQSLDMVHMNQNEEAYRSMLLTAYNEDQLVNYKITKVNKLNDVLYEVVSNIETSINGKGTYHNYVVFINDQWRIVINKQNIPSEITVFEETSEDEMIIIGSF